MRGVTDSLFAVVGCAGSCLLIVLSVPAHSATRDVPDYTFVQFNYVYAVSKGDSFVTGRALGEPITRDETYETDIKSGGGLKANWLLGRKLLLRFSGYGGTGEWRNQIDVDTQSLVGGLSYLFLSDQGTGIDLGIDYRRDNLEFDDSGTFTFLDQGKSDNTLDGPGVSIGIRKIFLGQHEFGARVGWYEGDFEGTASVFLGYAWNLGDVWSLALFWEQIDADVELDELSSYKLDQYGIGFRYGF